MGKKSKKQKNKKKKDHSRLLSSVAQINDRNNLIPSFVTQNDKIPDDLDQKIVLTFKNYNDTCCQLAKMSPHKTKKAISKLKELTDLSFQGAMYRNIVRDKIKRTPESESLYAGLDAEIDLIEIKMGKGERIFGHFAQRYFCLVSIRQTHFK
jgi:hypothetical protein